MPAPTNSTMFNMMAAMIGTGMNKSAANEEVDAAASPVLDLLDIGGYHSASGATLWRGICILRELLSEASFSAGYRQELGDGKKVPLSDR